MPHVLNGTQVYDSRPTKQESDPLLVLVSAGPAAQRSEYPHQEAVVCYHRPAQQESYPLLASVNAGPAAPKSAFPHQAAVVWFHPLAD